jgi:hypothetical protein
MKVFRHDGETRAAWAKRTQDMAQDLVKRSNGEIVIPHKTFNQGNIVALVKPGSAYDDRFEKALSANRIAYRTDWPERSEVVKTVREMGYNIK